MSSVALDAIHRELTALLNLARRLSLHDAAREVANAIRQLEHEAAMLGSEANGPATLKIAASREQWGRLLDTIRNAVAKEVVANADRNSQTGGTNTTEAERKQEALRQFAQAMGMPGLMGQAGSASNITPPNLPNTTGSAPSTGWGPLQAPPPQSPTSKSQKELIEAWKASREAGGKVRVVEPALERVFMRQCPCCGADVFYDREKDACVGIEPEAGYLKIRLKNGQVREVKVAEAALEP